MTPLTFITGVLLGTSASIAFGLIVVMFLFMVMGTDEPRIAAEWTNLGRSLVIFVIMTAICAVSFIGLLRARRWRWAAQGAMWAGVALTLVWFFG